MDSASSNITTPSILHSSATTASMSSQKDFAVAIVGGGIAGLVCAVGLARAGIEVDVFEAAVRVQD